MIPTTGAARRQGLISYWNNIRQSPDSIRYDDDILIVICVLTLDLRQYGFLVFSHSGQRYNTSQQLFISQASQLLVVHHSLGVSSLISNSHPPLPIAYKLTPPYLLRKVTRSSTSGLPEIPYHTASAPPGQVQPPNHPKIP